MAIRPVLKMGEPLLQRVAAPVMQFDAQLLELLTDMDDTMRALSGAGIAAPQIGVGLRVVIFELSDNPRYPHIAPVPYTVLVNPLVTPLTAEEDEGWEGCLSVPGLRGLVPRHRRVRYRGFDQYGAPIDRDVEGFHARVVQHEVDHLDGILFPQRVRDLRDLGFEDALAGRMTPMPDSDELERRHERETQDESARGWSF
jgi:peptide deformylase